MSFAELPHESAIPLHPFKIDTPQSELDDLKALLAATRLPTKTFENVQTKDNFGVTRKWIVEAKDTWLNSFDWRKQEERINAIPAFLASVKNEDGNDFTIHFAALFSKRSDAIPIIFSHGWPGSFLEFLPMLEMLKSRYKPDDLPYHLIVPSLPGFAYSSKPGTEDDFKASTIAYLFNQLMTGLGFESYAAQGGDIGSTVSCDLALTYPSCKVAHINFKGMQFPPEGTPEYKSPPLANDMKLKLQNFAYAMEHATRPSTVGLVVGCNPISLLAWLGEKYMEWSDITPSLETILSFTTLYWLTDTYPSSIYTYRWSFGVRSFQQPSPEYVSRPLGYSKFPKEILAVPASWVATTGNLVWSRDHEGEKGGHFAALEVPEMLWDDMEEFLRVAWGMDGKQKPT
ncbi:MAG: hypothetical protein TREMPRED_000846 [Tremellales sp. Tagirdzhanova-0007]|nr:MAG: hypothetical protein TREMPRED_000846 [Tremellales sp. Tagirdzhanova-0007]